MTNLVLLRHGQSYSNAGKDITTEHQNLVTAHGVMETLRHARNLRTVFPELHFDKVFVSPMHRAKQTAYNFLSQFDNNAVDITEVDALQERTFGWQNFMTTKDMIAKYGADVVDSWDLDVNAVPGENGETIAQVYDRVVAAYVSQVLPCLQRGEKVLIVSHYFVMKVLQSHLEHDSVKATALFEPKNCLPILYNV